jgi:hypothetical protein
VRNEHYRVEVHGFSGRPRNVMVWRRSEHTGAWIHAGSLAVPDGIDAEALEAEVMSRLPKPVAIDRNDKVYSELRAGLGR